MNNTLNAPFALAVAFTLLLAAALPELDASSSTPDAPRQSTGLANLDRDADGIPDLFDLCPGEPNTGYPDRDGDMTRDACDLTPNGDGLMHVVFNGRVWLMGNRIGD
jgi:hypothetical protein